MRRPFVIALLGSFLVGATAWYVNTAHICPVPLSYRLGAYDERFALARPVVVDILKEAATAWEVAAGRPLFVYDDAADFTVDFIFEERQERATAAESHRVLLDEKAANNDAAKAELAALEVRFEAARQAYEKQKDGYEARLAKFNSLVSDYNQRGGVPPEEWPAIEAESADIKQLQKVVNEEALALNTLVDELNQKREQTSAQIVDYNAEVREYNDRFGEAGAFTQGEFTGTNVTIYKYTNPIELRQVLAHELGHALGIAHVEEKTAIMYYLLEAQPGELTIAPADRAALVAQCGERDSWPARVRRVIRSIIALF
jgi:Matrixin